MPSERNFVRRLNFCHWTEQATVWITPEQWAACATTTSPDAFQAALAGRACFIGIDLSDKIDLSSVVCIFPRALEHEPAGDETADARLLEDQALAARPTIDCALDVLPFFWMPTKSLQRRAQEDKIPYPDWARDGLIITTPGSLIDHDAIVDFIIGTLAPQFTIRGIGIDQAGAAGVVSKLRRHFGEDFVDEVPQGFRSLTEASKLYEALTITGNLTHAIHPVMAMCITNMGKEENTWREIRPIKLNQRRRMDGGVALIDAIWKMTKAPPAQRSVYETRGLVVTR
jgi:phage terminase large subunit-like protein